MNINNKLSKEVADKYKLVNWKGGHRQVFGKKFGIIDLNQLTLDKADLLIKQGFQKLVKKKQSSQKTPEK